MIGFKEITCPKCKHYFMAHATASFFICPFCGKMFDYTELIPCYWNEACDYDPKRFKRDWIIKDEEFDMSRAMGNKV